ncbi:MAG: FAD-dependent oxidoreductase [Myxococcota bacterium]|nr:FAD-dependent oxidoreductase [Myxococcota bacterium]
MADQDPDFIGRRTFLKGLGGAAGLAALPAGASATATTPNGDAYDVIVIGGGFAGVTAARELQHAGLRTLILEARNRLGGRTFAARIGDELFELGGTWVHSTQPHVFAEVNRYGLELVDTNGGMPSQVLWWDGDRARQAGMREVLPVIKEALCASDDAAIDAPFSVLQALALLTQQMRDYHAGASTAFPNPYDPFSADTWEQADRISIRDRLDELDLPDHNAGLLEGVLGASAHGAFHEASFAEMLRWWALSGKDLERYTDSTARYRLRDGTSSLIEAMIEDGRPDVRLGSPVAEVVQDEDRVEVRTERGERFTARAAVAALPMNVLSGIRFTPALHSAKLEASRERHAGAGVKVYIRTRSELPPTAILAGESEPLSSIFSFIGDGHGNKLVAFGTDPAKIDVHSRAAVQDELRRFLPDVEVTDTLAYDWNLDPYSQGTWCVLRKGQMKQLAHLRESQGRVYFAGGDIAHGWRGFIDGAIESGNRVAHQLIAEFEGTDPRRTTAPAHAPAAANPAFRSCAACHPTDASGQPGVGPNLRGVFGRPVAGDPTFPYSAALGERKHRWSEAELDAFLRDPTGFAPGTRMPFAGLKDPADRAAVIEILRGLK